MIPIIDCHCHVYPAKVAARAVASIGRFYHLDMSLDGTFETLKREGGKAGIDHFVIFSVATSPSQVFPINRFIAETAARSGGCMTGLGTLHPESDDPERDVEEILKLGLKGVKLHHDFQGFGIDDRRCMRLYEICEGRLPVLMHTGDNRYDYSNPNRLKPVLEAFPGLTVIGAHLGGWSIWEQAANELCGFGNFYVDSSSSLYALTPEKAKELIRMYGADRVLYGDDFPMWPPAEELERFRKLGLTEQEQELILCRNAEKIFGIRLSNTDGGQAPADQRET